MTKRTRTARPLLHRPTDLSRPRSPGGLLVATVLSVVIVLLAMVPQAGSAQSEASRISGTWTQVPVHQVLRAFAEFSGKSIVLGPTVSGTVTAHLDDEPWDTALEAILSANGLVAVEDDAGIIRVDRMEAVHSRKAVEPILTRTYRLSFAKASELQATLAPLLSERGSIAIAESTNTLIVSDVARVQRAIAGLLR